MCKLQLVKKKKEKKKKQKKKKQNKNMGCKRDCTKRPWVNT